MRFTPKNAIDQRFFSVGKNTSDFKVGEKVVVTWSDVWAKTLSERINAKHHDTTMYNPSYWFNTNIEKNKHTNTHTYTKTHKHAHLHNQTHTNANPHIHVQRHIYRQD